MLPRNQDHPLPVANPYGIGLGACREARSAVVLLTGLSICTLSPRCRRRGRPGCLLMQHGLNALASAPHGYAVRLQAWKLSLTMACPVRARDALCKGAAPDPLRCSYIAVWPARTGAMARSATGRAVIEFGLRANNSENTSLSAAPPAAQHRLLLSRAYTIEQCHLFLHVATCPTPLK